VLQTLNDHGATYERARATIALDLPPEADADAVERVLRMAEGDGLLTSELSGGPGFLAECERADETDNYVALHDVQPSATVLFVDVTSNQAADFRWEELQVRAVEGGHEILCVPFFTKGLARGDVVASHKAHAAFVPEVSEVVRSSGSCAVRIIPSDPAARDFVRDLGRRFATEVEEMPGGHIMALGAPGADVTLALREELDEAESASRLVYDTGWS